MTLRAKLASEPYYEQDRAVRCDCFLLKPDDTPAEPPALIQLICGESVEAGHGRTY
jgi:hypothetical protein